MNDQPKILLIEDNEGDAELTIEALKSNELNAEINVITNGEEALKFLKLEDNHTNGNLPDLILLDINLPKVDGKEVLDYVKNDDTLKTIPVVILTSSALQKDISYSYEHHANCYVVKPGNLKEFMNMINAVVRFWIKCVTYPKKNK
jgi:CheY-like chemotaxis protein